MAAAHALWRKTDDEADLGNWEEARAALMDDIEDEMRVLWTGTDVAEREVLVLVAASRSPYSRAGQRARGGNTVRAVDALTAKGVIAEGGNGDRHIVDLCSHCGFEVNVGKTMAELEDEGHPHEGGLFEGQRPPVAELAITVDEETTTEIPRQPAPRRPRGAGMWCLPNSYRHTSHRRQPGRGGGVPEGRQSAPTRTRPLDRSQGHRTRVAIKMAIISSRLRPIQATGSEMPVTKILFRQGAADSSHNCRSP